MDQDKKSSTGAPSSDTTSALFVSARKKQLEEQEAQRRAHEKEEKRLAAEAEVRRLEQEVEARKRKAEEDARRVAEEARAMRAQAESNPDAILGAKAETTKEGIKMPKLSVPSMAKPKASAGGVAVAEKAPLDMKKLIIIGGAVVVVAIVIIVIVALSGGGGGSGDLIPYNSSQKGLSFSYPSGWVIDETDQDSVTLTNAKYRSVILFSDITGTISKMTAGGMDIVSAAESALNSFVEGIVGAVPADFQPQLQKSGSLVSGSGSFSYTDGSDVTNVDMYVTVIDDRVLLDIFMIIKGGDEKKARAEYQEIVKTVTISTGGTGATVGASAPPSAAALEPAPAGQSRYTSTTTNLTMLHPNELTVHEVDTSFKKPGIEFYRENDNSGLILFNYTEEAASLEGKAILDQFYSDICSEFKLEASKISELETYPVSTTSDGAKEYYLDFWYGASQGIQVSISVQVYEERGECTGVYYFVVKGDTDTLKLYDVVLSSFTWAS